MHALSTFDYAVIRVVPRVEREEFINAGVILSCPALRFLKAVIELDAQRLAALDPTLDAGIIRGYLDIIPRICAGGTEAGAISKLPQRARFHWLTAPRSTIIQTSPAHSGICSDPQAALNDLLEKMVRLSPTDTQSV